MPAERRRKKTILQTEMERALDVHAISMGAKPVPVTVGQGGRVARYFDSQWWRRNLRRELRRANEVQEHAAGHIRRKGACYVSEHACKVTSARDKANQMVLEGLEVVNEQGEAFNLLEVQQGSVSNPAIRRAELLTRCRGFEEAAEFLQHRAVFLTITTPSRFHRMRHEGGVNPKWEGATPKAGQAYLTALWRRIGRAWGHREIRPYGFRICEPHHDGTPHWHVLLFMPREKVGWFRPMRVCGVKGNPFAGLTGPVGVGVGAVGVAGRYAHEDTPGERGALEHRYKVERIDPNRVGKDGKKCTATGYLVKYIAKNIDGKREDGESVGMDYASGADAVSAAMRVRVWASTWGIRQFQQVGGPSVTVYRELRKLGTVETAQADLFDNAQAAADRGDWMGFYMVQGGPEVKHTELALKPYYEVDGQGKYGDDTKRVYGVENIHDGQQVQTRLHTWTVQVAGLSAVNAAQAEFTDYMNREKAVAAFFKAAGISGREEFHARAAGAWTGVNNCAQDKPVFDFSVFEPGDSEIPFLPEYSREGNSDAQMEEVWKAVREMRAVNKEWRLLRQ